MLRDHPIEHNAYEKFPPGDSAKTHEKLIKWILGKTPDQMRKELGPHRRPTKAEVAERDKGNNITFRQRGTAVDYQLARLKRDHPDILNGNVSMPLSRR